eukprot:scaffold120485_cov35-Tisochrysis_lutea.AAC.4
MSRGYVNALKGDESDDEVKAPEHLSERRELTLSGIVLHQMGRSGGPSLGLTLKNAPIAMVAKHDTKTVPIAIVAIHDTCSMQGAVAKVTYPTEHSEFRWPGKGPLVGATSTQQPSAQRGHEGEIRAYSCFVCLLLHLPVSAILQ